MVVCTMFAVMSVRAEETSSILIKSGSCYQYNGQKMDKTAYCVFLQNECPQAWKQYKQGRECVISGWTLFGTGMVATPIAGVFGFVSSFGNSQAQTSYTRASTINKLCIGVFAVSCAMVIASIPLVCVGHRFMDKSVDTFNRQCLPPLELSFQMTGTDATLVLNF